MLLTTDSRFKSRTRCHSASGVCSGSPRYAAGIVHHDIDPAEIFESGRLQHFKAAVPRDIGFDRQAVPPGCSNPLDCFTCASEIHVSDDDTPPLARQRSCRRTADADAAAGNHRHPACQFLHSVLVVLGSMRSGLEPHMILPRVWSLPDKRLAGRTYPGRCGRFRGSISVPTKKRRGLGRASLIPRTLRTGR
jgi:hypothetical protein